MGRFRPEAEVDQEFQNVCFGKLPSVSVSVFRSAHFHRKREPIRGMD